VRLLAENYFEGIIMGIFAISALTVFLWVFLIMIAVHAIKIEKTVVELANLIESKTPEVE
jgi:hypothetical protein